WRALVSKSLVATAYVLPRGSAARMAGAGLSPQLTATTMKLPTVLAAVNACAMGPLGTSLVEPDAWTKPIAAGAVWGGAKATIAARTAARIQSRLWLFMTLRGW